MQLSRIRTKALKLSYQLLIRHRRSFYIWLAVIMSAFLVADLASTHFVRGMQNSTFDLLMRYRIHYPFPDRDIVIVDIDEASLKVLASRFGRWPWSREVLAKATSALNSHAPKAIVFDILFSEPDLQNPGADVSFAQVVAGSKNVLVPMALLDEIAAKQTAAKNIPSVTSLNDGSSESGLITVALPYFYQQLQAQQLGTDNAHPDEDGIIRRFYPFQSQNGWRLPSIPVQVAKVLNLSPPDSESMVLNWRGPAYSYRFVSFSTVLEMIEKGDKQRLDKQFAGKIILVGSTATSLFDLRTTPVAKIHPGVEIMATAIDNVKNNDYLRELPRWFVALVSVAFMFLLAWSFHTQRHAAISDTTFIGLQLGLVAISYVALNATNIYLDMTIPITAGLVYFSVARLHAVVAQKAQANRSIYFFSFQQDDPVFIGVMAVKLDASTEPREFSTRLDSTVSSSTLGASYLVDLFEDSTVMKSSFANIALVYWMVSADVESAVREDAQRIQVALGLDSHFQLHSQSVVWLPGEPVENTIRHLVSSALCNVTPAHGAG